MPLSDFDLATLSWSCYNDTAAFDRIVDLNGDWTGIKHYPSNEHVIAFRGSTTIQDWYRDFQGLMIQDPDLGGVETGFMRGIRDVLAHVGDEVEGPLPQLYVTGHSLGAARALLFAGLLVTQGHSRCLKRVSVFGSPRAGGRKLVELLDPIDVHIYKNRFDPVCDVPLEIPLLEPYRHVRPLIAVDEPPSELDPWGIVADHHSELYVAAMKRMCL